MSQTILDAEDAHHDEAVERRHREAALDETI